MICPEHHVEVQRFLKRWAAKFDFDPKSEAGLYLPPETIKAMKWSINQFFQYQNEIFVIWPSTSYQSFSLGPNLSEELFWDLDNGDQPLAMLKGPSRPKSGIGASVIRKGGASKSNGVKICNMPNGR